MKQYTFKEMDAYLRFIFRTQKAAKLRQQLQIREDEEVYLHGERLCDYIDFALLCCDEQTQKFIKSEYIENNRDWWYGQYSHSTYYRIKKHCMEEFLHCLHK